MDSEQSYLDYRVKTHFKEMQRLGLKVGLFSSSFTLIALVLSYFGSSLFDVFVLGALSILIVTFSTWSLALLTSQNTIMFVQELNQEREKAMGRV